MFVCAETHEFYVAQLEHWLQHEQPKFTAWLLGLKSV
jgi:hypothetical protein